MFDLPSVLLHKAWEQSQIYLEKYRHWMQAKEERRGLLDHIENRLNRIQVVGRLSGLSEYELSSLAIARLKNRLDAKEKTNHGWPFCKSKWLALLLMVLVPLCSLWLLCTACSPCERMARMYGRKVLFQLEPYWDWQDVYYTRCLVPSLWDQQSKSNPSSGEMISSCDYCEEVTTVQAFTLDSFQHDHAKLEEHFAFNMANKIPFIYHHEATLGAEVQSWPLYDLDSVGNWSKFFSGKDFDRMRFCMFKSNLVSVSTPSQLFADLETFDPDFWFAHWENCATRAMKSIRKLFVRPSVLPAMVELSKPNWILMSGWSGGAARAEKHLQQSQQQYRGDTSSRMIAGKTYKQLSPTRGTDLLIVVQLHGRVQLKLAPTRLGCGQTCVTLHPLTLGPHQLAIVSATHWSLAYRPVVEMGDEATLLSEHANGTSAGFSLSLVLAGIHV